jgi:predicted transcriptional regulator
MIESVSVNIINPIFGGYIMSEKKLEVTEARYNEMCKLIDDQAEQIEVLKAQIENMKNGKGRKAEVLQLLKENDAITIVAMSERLGISTKNVSSQLTYLRQEGFNICTDVNGKKFLVE